ncbi:hypothetical protein PHLCEN_2v13595 [Hermanssonia centrifuga]|uniref:NADP-dependent oxidoreductase domain-containing protein n=1 Tax=Hermanssonia centrifuga TaxID=98765 RepID=A0A2R6NDZ6_9APHY|nr:hypothetical protein PHLCEN_2v13595 [Hermanssonia centrifuga]
MPVIAFGTGSKWKGQVRPERGPPLSNSQQANADCIGQDVTAYVEQAIDVGFSHIDTAQYYRTEEYVGAAIRESGLARSELYITTKFSGISTPKYAIENSLDKLGVESVDLYLIHNPSSLILFPNTWSDFEKFREQGLVK